LDLDGKGEDTKGWCSPGCKINVGGDNGRKKKKIPRNIKLGGKKLLKKICKNLRKAGSQKAGKKP